MSETYPTATQARHDALACVDGPVSVLAPELEAAIERAQWAAVREQMDILLSKIDEDCGDETCLHSACAAYRAVRNACRAAGWLIEDEP